MKKLREDIEEHFIQHFFPSFSAEHQKVLTDEICSQVEIWITEHILEEEESWAKTKSPDAVEGIHNVILNVFAQLTRDIK